MDQRNWRIHIANRGLINGPRLVRHNWHRHIANWGFLNGARLVIHNWSWGSSCCRQWKCS